MQILFSALPIVSLCFLIPPTRIYLIRNKNYADWRQAILIAGIVWGCWIVLTTELLNMFSSLQFSFIFTSHLLLIFPSIWFIFHNPNISIRKIEFPHLSLFLKFVVGVIVVIVIITGLIGIISPPNNFDSMTYHLSRVMHWAQNQSVSHYATHELRQLYQNPGAEFVILHLQILGSNDYLFNWVQWLSMIGTLLGISLITQQLGANLKAQILAALVTITIPMGILQSVTTQNDYVLSFWLVCIVSFILSAKQNLNWFNILAVAGSLSLAVFTKGTAYIFTAPFLIWFGFYLFQTIKWRIWQPALAITMIVLLMNGTHYYRNFQLFNSPLSPQTLGEFDYTNHQFTPAAIASNAMRNAALHIDVPNQSLRQTIETIVFKAHHLLNIDVNAPDTTWTGTNFELAEYKIDENTSGNFCHFLLILITIVWVLKQRTKKKNIFLFTYMMLIIAGFFLFAFYLKWQPWHSRLHLPLFILSSSVIGIMLAQFRYRLVSHLIVVLFIIQSLPYLLTNPMHPVIGARNIFNQPRTSQYFYFWNPIVEQAYHTTANVIEKSRCQKIGYILPGDYWEYPLWVLLQQSHSTPKQIRALNVKNESSILLQQNYEPCAVICIKCPETLQYFYAEKLGPPVLSQDKNFLFIKAP